MNRNAKIYVGEAVLLALITGGAITFAKTQFANARRQGEPHIEVTLSGVTERNGKAIPLKEAGAVRPGEVLRWMITSSNNGSVPTREYSAVGQIPVGTSFVPGSITTTAAADEATTVTYSIDGGKSYAAQPTVQEKQADGSLKLVPAPVSMYTQVRFAWHTALAAGHSLTASYKVRVK